MNNSINIRITNDKKEILITQNQRSFFRRILIFIIYSFTLYSVLFLFYFFIRNKIPIYLFVFGSAVFFIGWFILNRQKLKYHIISIIKDDNFYIINKVFRHKENDIKK